MFRQDLTGMVGFLFGALLFAKYFHVLIEARMDNVSVYDWP